MHAHRPIASLQNQRPATRCSGFVHVSDGLTTRGTSRRGRAQRSRSFRRAWTSVPAPSCVTSWSERGRGAPSKRGSGLVFRRCSWSKGCWLPRETCVIPRSILISTGIGGGAALRLLEDAGVDHFVDFVEEDSLTALPRLVTEAQRFDFAFVDGGHTFDCVFADTLYLCRLVRPGGLIVLDDIRFPAIGTACRFFELNMGCVAEPLPPAIAKRFAVLRTPAVPVSRPWDHFVPFG